MHLARHCRTRHGCRAVIRAVGNFQSVSKSGREAGELSGRTNRTLLHATFVGCSTVRGRAIYDVETIGVFMEDHFKIDRAATAEFLSAPFDDKVAVRCAASDRGEDP